MQSAKNMVAYKLYLEMSGSMFIVPRDQIESLPRETVGWEKMLKAVPRGLCSSLCISSKLSFQHRRSLFSKEELDNPEKVNRFLEVNYL